MALQFTIRINGGVFIITKSMRNEMTQARAAVYDAENIIKDINAKLLTNIEYEKAGDVPPYDYEALHATAQQARNSIDSTRGGLSDSVAEFCFSLFPILKEDGELVRVGTRINWRGKVKKAAVDLWDTAENNPDNNPSLWSDIMYRSGVRVIPEVITVADMFSKDELGWWGEVLYISLVDNNVYTPEQYAPNWSIYTE